MQKRQFPLLLRRPKQTGAVKQEQKRRAMRQKQPCQSSPLSSQNDMPHALCRIFLLRNYNRQPADTPAQIQSERKTPS